jgi:CIC family chloride channel protein
VTGEDQQADADPGAARSPQLRLIAGIVLVAAAAAAFAITFRFLLGFVLGRAYGQPDIVSTFHILPRWARIALPFAGGALAGVTALAVARGGPSQGVGDVMEAVVLGRVRLSMRVTLLKSLGSFLAIASGGSVGREGPIIQFGGGIGHVVARILRVDSSAARALIASGTAAGFAAAYNTPLAAVLFVLEIVTGVVALDAILPTVAATAFATALTRSVAGGGPIYGQRAFTIASDAELLGHAVLGLLAGLVAQIFMRMLSSAERLFASSGVPQPLLAALGGLAVGLCALWLPEVTGNGYEPLNALLDGRFALGMLALILVAKALATTASVASGSPGGVFTPTLLLGASLGMCFWHLLSRTFSPAQIGAAGGYALVGMAAMTAATTHAPMMASVLVFELSGDYAIVLPLLLATTIATLVSHQLRPESIYGAELRQRGVAWELTLEGRQIKPARVSKPPRRGP